jgi:hypothetical protein
VAADDAGPADEGAAGAGEEDFDGLLQPVRVSARVAEAATAAAHRRMGVVIMEIPPVRCGSRRWSRWGKPRKDRRPTDLRFPPRRRVE